MDEVARQIAEGFRGAGVLDQLNLFLGLCGVGLLVRRKVWGFPVGMAASVVQGVLFFRETFYADTLLQVFYFFILAWGWHHWRHPGGGEERELPVTLLGIQGWGILLLLAGVATVGWAMVAERWTDSRMPWRDAFLAAFGVAGQVLQARKQIDNWPLWVVVNAVAVVTYWHAGMAFTGILYLVYLAMAVAGWWSWAQALRRQGMEGRA